MTREHLRKHARADGPLTERQLHILQNLADGTTGEELASELFVSRHAIYTSMEYVKYKLRASNTNHAIAIALRRKLIK